MREVANPAVIQAHPFGEGPANVGLQAYDALYDLCDIPQTQTGDKRRWTVTDSRSLQGHFNIEESILRGYADPTTTSPQAVRLEDMLTRYHVALPFDEAERVWLFETAGGVAVPETLNPVRCSEATLISSGLHRIVYGRDLLRRWWAWRRDTEEFRGQGTVDIARETLRELVETVSPGLGLPLPYLNLRDSHT